MPQFDSQPHDQVRRHDEPTRSHGLLRDGLTWYGLSWVVAAVLFVFMELGEFHWWLIYGSIAAFFVLEAIERFVDPAGYDRRHPPGN